MQFLWAFVIGGAICVIGQLMFDLFKLTPAHTMATLVVIGAIIDGIGWYEPLVAFAGAGATVPITSFGNALVHGALTELEKSGWIGVISGIFKVTSAGVSAAIIFSFLAALVVRPKG
ncbi:MULTISPECIES: stage V sporulation protein AE [Paenibacillus]|uniref:Stage V sporulation protein AE n=1 Tax=Paenibacillus radicis (ex Gao et al. 2016) TaxID=1737354 RepID=A0A917HQR1_9BACL|nr:MULTISPECIES: stage V sporulation protein AE [Paenibacillus]GGG86490.1 stage V sporulation protein AE [Paenibacillus radicis (ex Gao et al. 2016)]